MHELVDLISFLSEEKYFEVLVHLHMHLFWMAVNEDYVGLKISRFWL